ncbi:hypothetical protein [Limosilactobacillus caecicola]|uniref:hypothetical protein n=1 Tax=Limosilactobacillus caecicola TaxID=2941332 RepID=UPI00204033EE|nr:hypothetical protein [Limosilactobacillus caecicola]
MTKLVVKGHQSLTGDVELSGDQQTIMAIQAASLLSTQGTVIIDNVPATTNVIAMNQLLQSLNVVINYDRHMRVLKMDATPTIETTKISGQLLLAAGAILARCHRVQLVDNGVNPEYETQINQLCTLFKQFGATVELDNEGAQINAERLTGTQVDLAGSDLIITLALMMATTMAQGISVLQNPSHDPAVVELAKVLNKMGARVHGAGTSTIRVQGVTFLHSTDYYALDDQEEAGIYMISAALTAGDILVRGARQEHQIALIHHLEAMGNTVVVQHNGIRVIGTKLLLPIDIATDFYSQVDDYVKMGLIALQMSAQGQTTIHGFTANQLNMVGCVFADHHQQLNYGDDRLTIDGPVTDFPREINTNSSVMGLLALMNALVAQQVTTINPAEVAGGSFMHLIDRLIELGAKMQLSFD